MKITVLASKVDADLTDYPVYVDLSLLPAGFHTNVNQTDARDIRVTSSDGSTEIPREVVFYDSATDAGELYFKGDVSSSVDTDFYIYYGNSEASDYAVTDTYGRNNVWTNGYVGVWHMGDATTSSIADSTGANDGTKVSANNPAVTASGKIGFAQDFASGNYITLANESNFDFNYNSTYSLEAWLKPDGVAAVSQNFLSKLYASAPYTGWEWSMYDNTGGSDALQMYLLNTLTSDGISVRTASNTIAASSWQSLAVTYSGSHTAAGTKFYINGNSSANTILENNLGTDSTLNNLAVVMGARADGYVLPYAGLMDEVRISSSARASTWISTEYNNQNSAATFFTMGVEEPIPTYNLTLTFSGDGTGIVSSDPAGIDSCTTDCSASFNKDASVVLTANTDADSEFISWSGDPDCTDGSITVSADVTCTATFNLKPILTVTKSGNGSGTVTSSPAGIDCGDVCALAFDTGTSVALAAVADAGSTFIAWSGDVDCSDDSVVITTDISCTAYFNVLGAANRNPTPITTENITPTPTVSVSESPSPLASPSESPILTASPLASPTETAEPSESPIIIESPTSTPTRRIFSIPTPSSSEQGTSGGEGPASSQSSFSPPSSSSAGTAFMTIVDSVRQSVDIINQVAQVTAQITSEVVVQTAPIVAPITTAVIYTPVAFVDLAAATASGSPFAFLFAQLGYFFELIGLKRRRRTWGVIYNSKTKKPIPFAKIELRDQANRILETRYADKHGRYGFLTSLSSLNKSAGQISLFPLSPQYTFPSQVVTTDSDFLVYDHIYRGGNVNISNDAHIVAYDIPLDPKSEVTETSKFHPKLNGFMVRAMGASFWIGLVAAPLNVFISPSTLSVGMLLAFFLANVFRVSSDLYRPFGMVYDAQTHQPLPYALVTLNKPDGERISFAVSDEQGRYFILTDPVPIY